MSPPAATPRDPQVRSLVGLGKGVRWLLGGMVVLFASAIVLRFMEMSLISGGYVVGSISELEASDQRLNLVQNMTWGWWILTWIVFLVWFNRAYRNLPGLGVEQQRRPGWAVGGWFVPFASLVIGPRMMAETWRASVRPPPDARGRPRTTPAVGWWLGLLLAGFVLNRMAWAGQAGAESAESFETGSVVHVIALLAYIGSTLLLAWLIQQITEAQAAGAQDPATASWPPPTAWPPDDGGPAIPVGPAPADPRELARQRRELSRLRRLERRKARTPWYRRRSAKGRIALAVGVLAGVAGAVLVIVALRTEETGPLRVGGALLVVLVVAAVVAALKAPAAHRRFARLAAAVTVTLVAACLTVAVRQVDACDKRGAVDLAGCDFAGDDLSGADLAGATLTGADLTGADLRHAVLTRAVLDNAVLARADLTDADLSAALLTGANLQEARMSGTSLQGARLDRAKLSRANLSSASLEHSSLLVADLSGVEMTDTNLVGADLSGASLTDGRFVGAGLSETEFQGANLTNTRFEKSNLSHANLSGANLTGVTMAAVNLDDAVLLGATGLSDAALAAGLGTSEAGLSRALQKGRTRVERRETVVNALGRVCGGEPAGGTKQYAPGPGLHPLILSGPGGGSSSGPAGAVESAIDGRDWEPAATRFAELVVCMGNYTTESVEFCGSYRIVNSGEIVTQSRHQVHRDVQIRAAATGAVVTEKRFLGEMPRPCEQRESFDFSEISHGAGSFSGPDVTGAEVVAWVAGVVDT